jgi:hypothetical protein
VKVRFRALIIAIVVLVAIDLVLRIPGLHLPIPTVYRMPSRTSAGYTELISSMSAEKTPRVAVVGDSVVWGSNLAPAETLSTYLTDALRARGVTGARAYNLGFVGAHSNDLLPVVAEVAQRHAADVILLNLDYRFYNPGSSVQSRYPEIYSQVDWSTLPVPQGLAKPPRAKTSTDAQRVGDDVVSRVWKLFSIRDYLMVSIFDETPSAAVARWFAVARARLAGRPIWVKKTASSLPLAELRRQFAVGTLDENNVYVRYLGAALDAARADNVPIVVWAGPVDAHLLDSEGIWNRDQYERNLAFLKNFVEARGGIFVDYTNALPPAEIVDSHHPMGVGYAKLAGLMAERFTPLLEASAASRGEAERR